jgi:hypothetical protein
VSDRNTSDTFANLPLSFVPNRGQTDARVRYQAQAPGVAMYFTRTKVVMSLGAKRVIELRFGGADRHARIVGVAEHRGRFNYLTHGRQYTDIPAYGAVAYRDLWPGIDLVFSGRSGGLKYEFQLAPGANPSDIRLAYAGIESLSITSAGGLAVNTGAGTLRDAVPRSHQGRTDVSTHFSLSGRRSYGFTLGAYDRTRPLVIDPDLGYSTFLGGSSVETGRAIAVDREGSAYVTGYAASSDFPTTPGAFKRTRTFEDVFVSKLTPDGTELVYSTFLGGGVGHGIVVDAQGNAYVAGITGGGVPTTAGAYDETFNGDLDIFLTKLNSTGSGLLYSTYIGGARSETSYYGKMLSVDGAGNAYVTAETRSTDFPTTPGAFDTSFAGGTVDGSPLENLVVAKLDPAGSALEYATYLGGVGQTLDYGASLVVDPAGEVILTGESRGAFPTTAGSFDPNFNGGEDAFVTKLSSDGSRLVYSTYLGGSGGDAGSAVATDASGAAYIVGGTSSPAFPVTSGAYDTTFNGGHDAFVVKLNPSGTGVVWGTFVGGPGGEAGRAMALDRAGAVHITGYTELQGFPTTPDAVQAHLASTRFADGFYAKLAAGGTALEYSTYLGGSEHDFGRAVATDLAGNAYIAGETNSSDFPSTPSGYDPTFAGGPYPDAFITKFSFAAGPPASLTLSPETATNTLEEEQHCVTATVRDAAGDSTPGVAVRFMVTGATSAAGLEPTDLNGEARFCYQGPELPGIDEIFAGVEAGPSDTAHKSWIVPGSTPGCRVLGGGRITAANDDVATFTNNLRALGSGSSRGRVAYTDHGPTYRFRLWSRSIDALVCEGQHATAFGMWRSTPFRVDLNDGGRPSRNDSYRILIGSGYDSGTQAVEGGNLKIRG